MARRSDADLHLGRHRELLPDMTVLVNQQRMHESPHGRFMAALHCAGRHGEALGVYRRLRTNLVAEPGLGSSAALAVLFPGGLPRRHLRDRPGGDRPVHRPTRHSRGRVAEMTRSTLRTAEGGARRTPDRSRIVLAPSMPLSRFRGHPRPGSSCCLAASSAEVRVFLTAGQMSRMRERRGVRGAASETIEERPRPGGDSVDVRFPAGSRGLSAAPLDAPTSAGGWPGQSKVPRTAGHLVLQL
ncbi:BTAD domain-containing putative transcriptional regulator [Streptomyces sp. NPDC051554]|uniref:BTAD domain-containing putative transcriptional regulator n=1 Tax=Streptomyces sp. NPDC051554 TaxID=3365656 RepID=UPI003793E711